jgi:DNA (cytosine-5)-methyltransferase 1
VKVESSTGFDSHGGHEYVENGDAPSPAILQSRIVNVEVEPSPDLGAAIGVEWDKLRPGESSDRYFNLVRPDPDEPVPTVTQAGGNLGLASVTHPTERRKFTIAELRRLCGFPDDFVLTGSYGQKWERLGRAVPPPMMRAVAAALAEIL